MGCPTLSPSATATAPSTPRTKAPSTKIETRLGCRCCGSMPVILDSSPGGNGSPSVFHRFERVRREHESAKERKREREQAFCGDPSQRGKLSGAPRGFLPGRL